jgi:hypothetical protein
VTGDGGLLLDVTPRLRIGQAEDALTGKRLVVLCTGNDERAGYTFDDHAEVEEFIEQIRSIAEKEWPKS